MVQGQGWIFWFAFVCLDYEGHLNTYIIALKWVGRKLKANFSYFLFIFLELKAISIQTEDRHPPNLKLKRSTAICILGVFSVR